MSLYEERLQRTLNAVHMKKVDKIPFSYSGPAYAAHAEGLTIAEHVSDAPKATTAFVNFCLEHPGIDTAHNPVQNVYGLALLWLSKVMVPGTDLPDDELWQIIEKERMTEEDYQIIIDGGYPAWVSKYMKEKIDDPMAKMAETAKGRPEIIQRIADEASVPVINGALAGTPIEAFCGARTLMNFFIDMVEEPELVKAAMDKAFEYTYSSFVANIEKIKPIGTWIGGWRAAPNLMSHTDFMEFVWPYEYQLITAAADRNVLPILHFDSDWTSELETLLELPAQTCLLMLDGSTDMRHARAILGDHMALQGDVPASMLTFGTADEAYNYTTKLIEDVGSTTGLVVSSGCDCPLNAKKENVDAMIQATVDYQVH